MRTEINQADNYVVRGEPDAKLERRFKRLVDRADLPEGTYQEFFEDHSEFLMPAFLLNHQVHFDAIVSQFRLNTDITADFCYLTKSSASWWLVLVEIERPNVPLFRADKKRLIPTAEFTARLAQIQEWKDAVSQEGAQITAQLDPIRKPLARNTVHFKYTLVVGRDPVGREEEAWRRIDQINGVDLRVVTFDSILRYYHEGRSRPYNVLGLTKGKVRFKKLRVRPDQMMQYTLPEHLILTVEDQTKLRNWGISLALHGEHEGKNRRRSYTRPA
jgi:hypothetical protein